MRYLSLVICFSPTNTPKEPKLIPNHTAFSSKEEWGDVRLIESGRDETGQALEGGAVDGERFGRLKDRCYGVILHTEKV
jgi:hypothetical protein